MGEDDRPTVPPEDVEREFARAERMLSDARKAEEAGISKATVVNRLYYACFHAAQGALYARGFTLRSHGRVQTLLGIELIRPGAIPREFGRFYNDMETYRRRVDYGTGDVERDAGELIERTEAFLDVMRDVVDERG